MTLRKASLASVPLLGRSPLKFFLLVFALSIPFWLIGGVTDLQLMPGLSVSGLGAFCPMVAALILVHRTRGASGVTELLRRSFDFERIKAMRWYAPILLLMAGVNVAVYGLMRWMDMPLPAPQIGVLAAPLMLLAFFIGALGEELGWSGYITDPMQDRWNALQTGVILGLVSILWHLVPLLLIGRSPTWIAWWCVYAMAARILIVWLYNNMGKSVFAVALFHATLNLSWMLFPIYGSHFDMRLGGLVMAAVAVMVTVVWGPQTLARHKCARVIERASKRASEQAMRTWESLLLLADLMAFLVLSIRQVRGALWMRKSPAIALVALVALVMAAAQWLAEGPRWQMLPAYALTVLLLLAGLLPNSASTGGPAGRKRLPPTAAAVAIALGTLALAIAAALPMMVPVFRFAPPTGPYAIGTLTYHWVDASRSDAFAADPSERRQLMVQIWYPAQADPSTQRAAYMADADAVTAAFARLQDKPTFLIGHFKYVTTNAMSTVPAAVDQPRYPVLLFLAGATGFRQMNTFQVEHLVSNGYIVAAIDQPGTAAAVVFPDGHHAAGLTVPQFHALVGPSYMPGGTDSPQKGVLLPNGSTLHDNSIIPYLARDVSFTLDQLAALNLADPHGILTGKLDLQRVGIFGASLGGIVAGDACRLDARLRACLVMDAPMSIDVVKAGLQQPSLWITRDAASMRLERQRAGGWPDAEIEAHQNSMRAAYEGLSGAGYFVRVPGMFHSNFTDVASWTPLAPWLGLSGPIDERRAHGIVNAYSLAFFDRHLLGRPAPLLDGAAKRYPEVLFESRRP